MDNTITVVGNVVRDPELKFIGSGQANVKLGVAVNRRWQNKQQEWQEKVSYFDVTAWQQTAENVANSVRKGDRVVVTGRLEQRSWETPEGEKRYAIEIVADEIAPSLKYATAVITKTPKPEGGGSRATPAPPQTGYAFDEEPF